MSHNGGNCNIRILLNRSLITITILILLIALAACLLKTAHQVLKRFFVLAVHFHWNRFSSSRTLSAFQKGCGYHLDLFVVAILIIICSAFGLPWFVAATVLAINHVKSLSRETETSAPGEKPQFLGIRFESLPDANSIVLMKTNNPEQSAYPVPCAVHSSLF